MSGTARGVLVIADEDGVIDLEKYPDHVETPEQQRRWGMARKVATDMSEGEAIGPDALTLFFATRALYNSDIPTDPPDN